MTGCAGVMPTTPKYRRHDSQAHASCRSHTWPTGGSACLDNVSTYLAGGGKGGGGLRGKCFFGCCLPVVIVGVVGYGGRVGFLQKTNFISNCSSFPALYTRYGIDFPPRKTFRTTIPLYTSMAYGFNVVPEVSHSLIQSFIPLSIHPSVILLFIHLLIQ